MKKLLSLSLALALSLSVIQPAAMLSAESLNQNRYPSSFAVDFGNYAAWLRSTEGGQFLTSPTYDDGTVMASLSPEKIVLKPSAGSVGGFLYTNVTINLDHVGRVAYSMDLGREGAIKIKDEMTGVEYSAYFSSAGSYNDVFTDVRGFFAEKGITGARLLQIQLHGYFETAEFYNLQFVSDEPNLYAKLGMDRYGDWLMMGNGGVYLPDKSCSDEYLRYYVSHGKIILSPVENSAGGFIYFPITLHLDKVGKMNFALQTKNEAIIKLKESITGKEISITKKTGNYEESFDIRSEFAKIGITGVVTVMVQLHSYFDETIFTKVEFARDEPPAEPADTTVVRNPNVKADIIADNSTDYRLIAEDDVTCRFAASEFQEYMKKMTGVDMVIDEQKQTGQKYIVFGTKTGASVLINSLIDTSALKFDGFQITQEGEDIVFSSNSPRGVLFAVYDFIERQGASFVCTVDTEEFVPSKSTISLNGEIISNPDLEIRGMSESPSDPTDQWLENFDKTLDLWAKNKINSIFLHLSAGWNLTGNMAKAAEKIKLRGMQLEVGGHGIYNYVPRSLFETKPELFRMIDGQRTPTGNICASSDEAIQMIGDGVCRYFSQNPDVDIYRGWFEDVVGGSWCSCPECKDISPLQQQYIVLARVNELVAAEFPGKKVDMLVYHDTIEGLESLDTSINPGNATKIDGLYAPRERCYAHALDDPDCELNKVYLKALKDTIRTFGSDSSTAFEYYADFVLYQICETNFAKTISEDLKVYLREGMLRVTPLTFDNYSNWAYGLNNYVYSKHAWDTSLQVEDTIKTYSSTVGFDASDNGYVEYLQLIEEASAKAFAYCGYDVQYNSIPEMALSPASYYAECIENLKEAVEIIDRAKLKLAELQVNANEKTADFLAAESKLLELTGLNYEAFYYYMQGRYYMHTEPEKHTGNEMWEYYKKAEANKKKMRDLVDTLGNEYLGVKGQSEIPTVFCGFDHMWAVYNQEIAKLNATYHQLPGNYTVIKEFPNNEYAGWMAIGDTVPVSPKTTNQFGEYTFDDAGVHVLPQGDLGYSFVYCHLNNVNLDEEVSLIVDAQATSNMCVKVVYAVNGAEKEFVMEKPAGTYKDLAMNISKYLRAQGLTGKVDLTLQFISFTGGTGVTFSQIRLVREKAHIHVAGEWEIIVEPICTEQGTRVKKCTECGEVMETEVIGAKGHSPGAWEIVLEPTCTGTGKKVRKCTGCNEVLAQESLPAKGHDFGDWTVTREPSSDEDGEEIRTCQVCFVKERRALKFQPEKPQTGDTNIVNALIACVVCGGGSALAVGMKGKKRRKTR